MLQNILWHLYIPLKALKNVCSIRVIHDLQFCVHYLGLISTKEVKSTHKSQIVKNGMAFKSL